VICLEIYEKKNSPGKKALFFSFCGKLCPEWDEKKLACIGSCTPMWSSARKALGLPDLAGNWEVVDLIASQHNHNDRG
jgi:hypothetical protein